MTIKRLLCLISFHSWDYWYGGALTITRDCARCGRREGYLPGVRWLRDWVRLR